MRRPYEERVFGAPKPLLVTRSIPPPVDTASIDFVGKFLLVGIALMIAVTLLTFAPSTVAIPLGLVLVTYGVVALAIVRVDRRRPPRRRDDRPRGPSHRGDP